MIGLSRHSLAIALGGSLALHAVAGEMLARAPGRARSAARGQPVEIDVRERQAPAAAASPSVEPPAAIPPPRPVRLSRRKPPAPPPDLAPPRDGRPPPPADDLVPRVFGATLSGETVGDVALPRGNTLDADPNRPRPNAVPAAPPTRGAAAPPSAPTGFAAADDAQIASFPEAVEEVKAPYPAQAESQRVQGTVPVRVEVNADGSVHNARVLKSLGYGLDEAAVRALRRFRFQPARDRSGRAVACVIVWRYTFTLEH